MREVLTYLSRVAYLVVKCLFVTLSLSAQNHDFIQYTTKDGLPTNYVYGAIEDDEGYIWVYTENGISKFDGYTFQNFSVKDGLPGNDIVYAIKDQSGKICLWTYQNKPAFIDQDSVFILSEISTQGMLLENDKVFFSLNSDLMYFSQDELKLLESRYITPHLLERYSNMFTQDTVCLRTAEHPGHKWLTNISTYFKEVGDSITYYKSEQGLFPRYYKDGYAFLNTVDRSLLWNRDGENYYVSLDPYFRDFRSDLWLNFFRFSEEGTFLVNPNLGEIILVDMKCQDVKRLNLEEYGLDVSSIHSVISNFDTAFIVSAENGFLEFDVTGQLLDRLILDDLADQYTFNRSFRDSKGNIWIGTRQGGIFMLPKQKKKTRILKNPNPTDQTFEQLIALESGRLIGITDNSGVYEIVEGRIEILKSPDKSRFRQAAIFPFGILMSSADEGFIIQEIDGQIAIKRFEDYFSIDSNPQALEYLVGRERYFKSFRNRLSMTFDQEENIIITSTTSGICLHKIISEKLLDIDLIRETGKTLFYHPFQSKVFLGNAEGLYVLKNKKLTPFLISDVSVEFDASLKNISALYGDKQRLWIGTESMGLFVYDFAKKVVEQVSDVGMVRNIRPDSDSTLLLATNEGAIVISTSTDDFSEVSRFTKNDGLSSNEIRDVYFEKGKFIYAVTNEGVQQIDRFWNVSDVIEQGDLVVRSITVNRDSSAFRNQLNYQENNLQFNFHLMSHSSNKSIQYFTRLAPLETEWQTTTERKINYLSLLPGAYTFYLKAKDVYGNEIEHKPISFEIKKAFWQTGWFISVGILSIFGLVVWLFNLRESKHRRQVSQEKATAQKMAKLELSALKAQMNPHFVFNALGAIQYFIQTNEVDAADDYLTRFALLIRKYLDSSKEKMITLKEEIELLTIYTDLEKLRFEELFDVNILVDDRINLEDRFIPSMIIQPFIENAINHGLQERQDGKGQLEVFFFQSKNTLIVEIRDNGIGREAAMKRRRKNHKSLGLSILKDKIETFKTIGLSNISINIQELIPEDSDFPGTQVIIKIKDLEDEDL